MNFRFISLIFCITFSLQGLSQNWTTAQLDLANTAKNISYLTKNEKDAILYINLCRLFPKEFAKKEVRSYSIDSNFEDSVLEEFELFKSSLLKDLSARASCKPLKFDNTLYLDAKCYSAEISKADREGHDRKDCKDFYYAECISFGQETGKDIAMQWLIDSGIKSVGHRKTCLDKRLIIIGLSANKHFEWSFCAVAEFK